MPILSGLFVFPLFFYFNKLGFGASAIYGGLIATFGHAYYDRTMMGRVDTDLLNTFFPLLVACFILFMGREKSWRVNLCLSVASGLTMYLFTWWYQQPVFIAVYFFVMAAYLVLSRVPWKQIAPILLVFLLASGPEHVAQVLGSLQTFLKAYVSPPPTGGIAWPNIMSTVAEVQNRTMMTKLKMLHGFVPLVYVGFAGLAYLCIRRFRQMIPVAPLIAVGVWAMIGPNRFVMYLAPIIGVGTGVFFEVLIKYAWPKIKAPQAMLPVVSLCLMFTLFFSTARYTGFYAHAGPIIPASMVRALLEIKRVVPKNSAMFTPYWEYGYPLMEIGDFATYHDGSLHGGIRTTLTAKATMSDNQADMVSLMSYLEDHGFNPLSAKIRREKLTADDLMELVFNYPEEFKGENVYVIYLEGMMWKLSSLSYFGTWDFAARTSESLDFVELHCFSMVDNIMRCRDGTIDLNRGFMNDGSVDIPLRAALFVDNGYVVERFDYDRDEGYYLQVLEKNGKVFRIIVADEQLFRTNFNQQYLLGYYDQRYFEEVYNDFPVARVLRVKKTGSGTITD